MEGFLFIIWVIMKINPIVFAVLAAALYALNSPLSKLLLSSVSPEMMAGFLYLGAGIGMFIIHIFHKNSDEKPLTKKDLPYTILMVILDIAAPILMMTGLKSATAANASLLNNFEIVATSLIALIVFKERIRKMLWAAIVLIVISSALLSFEDVSAFSFSIGSIFVIIACTCWGLENNCTRMISGKSPEEIVIIKGLGSGIGALIVAFMIGAPFPALSTIPLILLLGFASYGLSVFFYVYAQRYLGAARTSAYYALSPFIGSFLSFIILHEQPTLMYDAALIVMIAGTVLVTMDSLSDVYEY